MVLTQRFVRVAAVCATLLFVAAFLGTFAPQKAEAAGFIPSFFNFFNRESSRNAVSCPPFSSASPLAEVVSGYTTVLSPLYILTKTSTTGTTTSPSPLSCSNAKFGVCISNNFNTTQGVKIAALTAKAHILQGALTPGQVSVDAVTHRLTNNCGQKATEWSYVVTPSAASLNMMVPKDTAVDVSYACQPTQTYTWTTSTSCFLGIGTCNVKRHSRTFRFADRVVSSLDSTSSKLSGEKTFVASAGSSYALSCGGYRPENGSTTPPMYDVKNVNSGVCIFGIDCNSGTESASYNVADSSYMHPGLSLSVAACESDDDIVVDNVCTPCATLKPGSHRVGNVCAFGEPTLHIDTLVGGVSTSSVPVGSRVTVQATYESTSADPIADVDITGGSADQNTSVCGTRKCLTTTYAAQKVSAVSTYTFTARNAGTYTFYPSVKTTILNAWQNHGNVSKTITVGSGCPAGASGSGSACACGAQYHTLIGSSCVLTCPTSMHASGEGDTCITNLPTPDQIDFTAVRVRANNPSTLTWSIPGMNAAITCGITPHAGLTSTMPAWSGVATWSGSVSTIAITKPTNYTLTCTNGEESVNKGVTVQLLPDYREI